MIPIGPAIELPLAVAEWMLMTKASESSRKVKKAPKPQGLIGRALEDSVGAALDVAKNPSPFNIAKTFTKGMFRNLTPGPNNPFFQAGEEKRRYADEIEAKKRYMAERMNYPLHNVQSPFRNPNPR